jgi:hypothetical protein
MHDVNPMTSFQPCHPPSESMSGTTLEKVSSYKAFGGELIKYTFKVG